jgi:putative MATE family efflux protein
MKTKNFDFTEGPISNKMLLFAWPTFIANLLQSSYQFIDSLWVGNLLGADALAAVSVSAPIIFTILAFIIGINSATLTILSQQKGRKDEEGLKKSLNAFVFILGILTLFLGILGFFASSLILRLLGTPDSILPMAEVYLQVNFLGIFFLFGYNFISTILRALGNSKAPMQFVLTAVLLNAVLDPLFIYVFNFGIAGAAYATLISQGTAFLYGLWYSINKAQVPFSLPHVPEKKEIQKVLKLGLPGGLQMVAVSSGMIAIMAVINSFGTEVVAGFGAAQRIDSIILLPAMTLGSVVNSMSGQNIGAVRWDRVTEIAKKGTILILICSTLISAAVFLSAEFLIRLFVQDPASVRFGTAYLQIVAFFYPFLGINFILNGIARSSGAMMQVLVLNIISFWILRFPLAYLFSGWLGANGIAYGIGASFVLSAVIAGLYYQFGKWRNIEVS